MRNREAKGPPIKIGEVQRKVDFIIGEHIQLNIKRLHHYCAQTAINY